MNKLKNRYLLLVLFVAIGYAAMTNIIISKEMQNLGIEYGADRMLDTKVLYSAKTAYTMLGYFGEEGRSILGKLVYPLDMGIATLFAFAFFLFVINLYRRIFEEGKKEVWYWLLVLCPLLSGVFDIIENLGVIYMVNNFEHRVVSAVSAITGPVSLLKFIAFFMSIVVIVILEILLQRKRFIKKKQL